MYMSMSIIIIMNHNTKNLLFSFAEQRDTYREQSRILWRGDVICLK